MNVSLQEYATLLGGYVSGNRVRAPGPEHSAADDSLSVTPAKNDDGFVVKSFAGDDRQACIAHVKAKLDPEKCAALAALAAAIPARDVVERAEDPLGKGWYGRWLARKVEGGPRAASAETVRAREILAECVSPIATIVEVYLWQERHLDLPPDIAGPSSGFTPNAPGKMN